MKKLSLRFTSGILSLAMLLSTSSMVAFSAENTKEEGVLAFADFEEYTAGEKITYDPDASYEIASRQSSHPEGAFVGCCSRLETVDATKNYYLRPPKDSAGNFVLTSNYVTVASDPTGGARGSVVKLTSGVLFGISEHNLENSAYTNMYRNPPAKIRFEFDVWKEASAKVTIRYGNPFQIGEILALNSSGGVNVFTESNNGDVPLEGALEGVSVPSKQWVKYDVVLETQTRKCTLYVNGEKSGSWTLDDNWTMAYPDFSFSVSSGKVAYIDNLKVSEDKIVEVLEKLEGTKAVMNFAQNAVADGEILTLDTKDMIITAEDGTIIAPTTLFEKVFGATVDQSSGRFDVTIDGTTKDLTEFLVSYDGIKYLKLNKALSAFGKNHQTVDMVTMIGDNEKINLIKNNEDLFTELKVVLNENKLSKTDVSKEDWTFLKDKWRAYILGDENLDIDDPDIATKISRIDSLAKSSIDNMIKNHDENSKFTLFGSSNITNSAQITTQYTNLTRMAIAYGTKGSTYYKDETLKTYILYGLEWLYKNVYGENFSNGLGYQPKGSDDSWDFMVGAPSELCKVLLVMEPEAEVTPELIDKYLTAFDYSLAAYSPWAANRIFGCTAAAALREDFDAMIAMRNDYNRMLKTVESGNGVREDWLYITHKYFAYTSAYGCTTLADRVVAVESVLSGTKFEFATPYKYNSCMWMYETFAPALFNGAITSVLSGRFRTEGYSEASYARYAIGAMLDLVGAFGKDDDIKLKKIIKRNVVEDNKENIIRSLNISQIAKLAKILNDNTITVEPYDLSRVYYSGDAVVHQKDDIGFALGMSSSRIAAWESIGGDNKSGWYNGDGLLLMHLADDVNHYNSTYWDNVNPYHLPGTTVDTQKREAYSISDSSLTLTNQDFVGGANLNEKYSTAAMQLESHHNDKAGAPIHSSTLMAKKAWFMFDDEVVALGADIDANDGFEVETIVENRKLTKTQATYEEPIIGAETITVDGKALEKVNAFSTIKSFENPNYVNIEGKASYFFPEGGSLKMNKINNAGNFLEMWLSHGVSPQDGKYSYVVLPKKTVSETEEYTKTPDVEILANTEKIQSVKENTLGVTGTVFWEAGSFDNITVSQPMIVMAERKDGRYTVSISDPTKKLTTATVKLAGEYSLISCDERLDVATSDSETVITVDFSGSNGRSLEIEMDTLRDPDTIANEDFEEFGTSTISYDATATSEVSGKCCSSTAAVDSTKKFYIANGKSVSLVSDPDEAKTHGKVASLSQSMFGISEHNQKTSAYYAANAKLPDKLKLEFDLWKDAGSEVTIRYGSASDSGRLFTLNANDGLTVYQSDDASTAALTVNNVVVDTQKWTRYTICLNTEKKRVVLYADGEYLLGWTLPTDWTAASPDFTFVASGAAYVDNFNITEHKELIIEKATPADKEGWVSPETTFTAKFNRTLTKNVDNSFVTVTDGSKAVNFKASASGDVLTVAFPDGLEFGKTYTITIKSTLESKDGISLGKDVSLNFETMPFDKNKFTDEITNWTFDEPGETIVNGDKYMLEHTDNKKGDTVVTTSYAKIVSDATLGSNVAEIHGAPIYFGIPSKPIEDYKTKNGGEAPKKVMLDFKIKKNSSTVYFMCNIAGNTSGTNIFRYSSSNKFQVYNKDKQYVDLGANGSAPNNKWHRVQLFFDFSEEGAEKVYVFVAANMSGEPAYIGTYETPIKSIDKLNIRIGTTDGSKSTASFDDFKLMAYGEFALSETNIKNGANGVDPETAFVATFAKELGEVSEDSVAITGGSGELNYQVSKDKNVLKVTFPDGLEFSKDYTITLKSNIKSSEGMLLGENKAIEFKTAPLYIGRYKAKIEEFTFEDVEGDSILAKTDNIATNGGKKYYATNNVAFAVEGGNKYGNAATWAEQKGRGLGVPEVTFTDFASRYGAIKKAKVAVDFYGESTFYMMINGLNEIMRLSKDGYFAYANGAFISGTISGSSPNTFYKDENKTKYEKGTWYNAELYFDFDEGVYHIFVDGEYKITASLPAGVETLSHVRFTGNAACVKVDNVKVSAYEHFVLESTTPSDNAGGVNADTVFTAVFSEKLGDVDNSVVTITGGENETKYNVSKNGKVLTVKFSEALELGKTYTIVLKESIKNAIGTNLGEDIAVSFTTALENMPSGFDSVIAAFDFESYKTGHQIKAPEDKYVDAETGDTFYLTANKSVSIVEDKYGNAIYIPDENTLFGIATTHIQKHPSYNAEMQKYADKVKVEFRMKRGNGTGAYLFINGKHSPSGANELMLWSRDTDELKFSTSRFAGRDEVVGTYPKNKWIKITLYFDFTEHEYYIFVNDEFKKVVSIPGTKVNEINEVVLKTVKSQTTGGQAWVDDLSITTLPACSEDIISEYRLTGEKQLGYSIVNQSSVAKTIKEIKAHYNQKNVLVSTEVQEVPVDANQTIFRNFPYPDDLPADGGYFKYFVWEGFESMIPIKEPKEIR